MMIFDLIWSTAALSGCCCPPVVQLLERKPTLLLVSYPVGRLFRAQKHYCPSPPPRTGKALCVASPNDILSKKTQDIKHAISFRSEDYLSADFLQMLLPDKTE